MSLYEMFTVRSKMARGTLLAAATTALLAGCGASGGEPSHGVAAARQTMERRACVAGSVRRLGSADRAYAAVVRSRATVLRRPGGPVLKTFGRLNANGVPTVFSVVAERVDAACRPTAYRVQVAMRPNGASGWVPAHAVAIGSVTTRIDVDLSRRRLTLYRAGRRVLEARVAIGSAATPTPTGRYYVNQRLRPADPSGPFGPGAVGISAFSNVLTGWTQGGPIAIHGTNAPWSIGRAVSNGCIRLPNPVLRRVFRTAFAGTPVVIHR
jgi:lipoprotein-anchoring transpeptidase ErfK/SrfK